MRTLIAAILLAFLSFGPSSAEETAPDTSAIEAAHAAWTAKANNKTRKALDEALGAYVGPPTTKTVIAHLERMTSDANKKDFGKLRISSLAVVEHLEPVADQVPERFYDTKMIAAISLFNHRQKKEALIEMTEVKAQLHGMDHLLGDELPDWVEPMEHRAHAWQLAMTAYFDSANKPRPSDRQLDKIEDDLHPTGFHDEDPEEEAEPTRLPFCDGDYLKKKSLRYPAGGVRKGMYGAVIVEVDTIENGQFQNVTVLAAVPSEGFKEHAKKVISTWAWKPKKSAKPGEDCELERTGSIIPIVFALD